MCVCVGGIYIYHIFLTHSSINRHLGCFRVLDIVNTAAMNIGVNISFSMKVCLDICPEVGWLGHMIALYLVAKFLKVVFLFTSAFSVSPPSLIFVFVLAVPWHAEVPGSGMNLPQSHCSDNICLSYCCEKISSSLLGA